MAPAAKSPDTPAQSPNWSHATADRPTADSSFSRTPLPDNRPRSQHTPAAVSAQAPPPAARRHLATAAAQTMAPPAPTSTEMPSAPTCSAGAQADSATHQNRLRVPPRADPCPPDQSPAKPHSPHPPGPPHAAAASPDPHSEPPATTPANAANPPGQSEFPGTSRKYTDTADRAVAEY